MHLYTKSVLLILRCLPEMLSCAQLVNGGMWEQTLTQVE